MKFYARHDEDLQINLTPLIDVVFLLLIFFMVSTTFEKESKLQIRLPEATAEAPRPDSERIVEIQISESGQFAVRGPARREAGVLVNANADALRAALREARGEHSDVIVVIRADREATHESVVRAMDAARRLNLLQVTFATRKTAE